MLTFFQLVWQPDEILNNMRAFVLEKGKHEINNIFKGNELGSA